jgi:3-phenylpropionate/trans-cinnamate dioxygenase ferredoxin component
VAWVRVARAEEIPPGRTLFVCVEGRPLLIARVGDEVFALDGLCPHRENPLDGATLLGYLLDCPWHHFQYDVRSGENRFPRNVYPADMPHLENQLKPIRKYAVKIEDGEIRVNLE